jgi:hypothetical protein
LETPEYDDDPGSMPRTANFRLHDLPAPALRCLLALLGNLTQQRDWENWHNKQSNPYEKANWSKGQADGLLYSIEHPRCLVRRKDFVPLGDYQTNYSTSQLLDAAFGRIAGEVDWLVEESLLPPVQLSPGIRLVANNELLLAAFGRTLQQQGRTCLRFGPKLAEFTAWPESTEILRIENPAMGLSPSHYKNHMVWLANTSTLSELINKLDESLHGTAVFSRVFAAGVLCNVASSSFDNAKFKLRPMLPVPDTEGGWPEKHTVVVLGNTRELFWASCLVGFMLCTTRPLVLLRKILLHQVLSSLIALQNVNRLLINICHGPYIHTTSYLRCARP